MVVNLEGTSAAQVYMAFILVLSEEELLGLLPSILVCIQYVRPDSVAKLWSLLAADWRGDFKWRQGDKAFVCSGNENRKEREN